MTIAPETKKNRPEMQIAHLTEDQMDDHLIGDLGAAPAAHLAACSLCMARVAQADAPLASFRAVTLAWSERQSATAPMPTVAAARSVWERRLAWSLAVATCAVVGLAHANHRASVSAPAPQPVLSQEAVAPSADQLSSDNRLLNSIDRELSASNESSDALGLVPVSSSQRSATRVALLRTSVQD
jgi:hypothetical protein